jgi:hypothetical protein
MALLSRVLWHHVELRLSYRWAALKGNPAAKRLNDPRRRFIVNPEAAPENQGNA